MRNAQHISKPYDHHGGDCKLMLRVRGLIESPSIPRGSVKQKGKKIIKIMKYKVKIDEF